MSKEALQKPDRLSTGVAGLDRVLGRLLPRAGNLIGGRAGLGQDHPAKQMAYAAAGAGKRVGLRDTGLRSRTSQYAWQLSSFAFFAPSWQASMSST